MGGVRLRRWSGRCGTGCGSWPAILLAGAIAALGAGLSELELDELASAASLARWRRPRRCAAADRASRPNDWRARSGLAPRAASARGRGSSRPRQSRARPSTASSSSTAAMPRGIGLTSSMASTCRPSIIDYGSGNLRSAAKAFERAAREGGLRGAIVGHRRSAEPCARAEPHRAARRRRLRRLHARPRRAVPGMVEALTRAVRERGRPFLGICVGMQLMAERGLEYGDACRASAGSRARSQPPRRRPIAALKIPHMGWNELSLDARAHPLLAGIAAGAHAYFVHCYQLRAARRRRRRSRTRRLWRRRHGDGRPRQHRRHAVPSGEEPGGGACAPDRRIFLRGGGREAPGIALIVPRHRSRRTAQCVRLRAAATWTQATVFNDDPADQARALRRRPAAQWLHVVDLDGAFAGQAGQRRGGRGDPRGGRDRAGAARRRHPRLDADRRAGSSAGVRARHPRHGGAAAIPTLVKAACQRWPGPHRRRHRCARRLCRGRGLGQDLDVKALDLALRVRGCRRRGDRLHRYRAATARWPGPMSRRRSTSPSR